METDELQADKKFEKLVHRGRGRRVEIVVVALVLVGALIGVVIAAFRGQHVSQDASAMTKAVTTTPTAGVKPPATTTTTVP